MRIHLLTDCCALLLSAGVGLSAQSLSSNYRPLRDYDPPQALLDTLKSRYDSCAAAMVATDKETAEVIAESYGNLNQSLAEASGDHLVMYSDSLTRMVRRVLERIRMANPGIAGRPFEIFVFRTDEPNATSRGADVLFMNLGLMARLTSEAELAFIVCHEMSHAVLEHVQRGIVKRTELVKDKEFQLALKKLKKEQYNVLEKLEKLYAGRLKDYLVHSRGNELEADSLGVILYRNAGYDARDAVFVIARLDSIDKPICSHDIDFTKHFDFADYPLSQSGFTGTEGVDDRFGSNLNFTIPDSLKTHPDCRLRSERIMDIYGKAPGQGNKTASGRNEYAGIQAIARFETVEYYMQAERYGKALHRALAMASVYPENLYLRAAVVHCLNEIGRALKEHRFSRVVAFPYKYYEPDYNRLLSFLHDASGSTIGRLAQLYFRDHVKGREKGDAFASYLAIRLAASDKTDEEKAALADEYGKQFGDNYYLHLLRSEDN